MAIILFGTQQQKGQQDSETTYKEFIEKATGRVNLRGQYVVDEGGLRIKARTFLEGMLNDDITLTPCIRYQAVDEGNNGAFVSPLTRGRNTGWSFGNAGDAFLSVNTMVGLLNRGFQLPEYRATRVNPRPTGQVGDEMMWITGPWAERGEFKLYAADADGNIEPLESWITRKLNSLQSVN
jgi:hypothetical protein